MSKIDNMDETVVYDKAKFHFEGDFPAELDRAQAYVHIGMFLGWVCYRNLLSAEMEEDYAAECEQFCEGKMTGADLLRIVGGTLASDMLSPQGNAFAKDYFTFNGGNYIADYAEVLGRGLCSLYHVKDTWENFERLKGRIDERYRVWSERLPRGNQATGG